MTTPPAAIEVSGLTKEFGGLRAVDRVSLSVAPGERRVLIGPNGAGKTTLFHCITGTLRPSAGRVSLFGREVTRLPEHRRTALGMGRTFQISNVFADLSLFENLALAILGTDRRKWMMHRPVAAFDDVCRRAREGLELVGLAHRERTVVRLLSYGERRQLELALALSSGPRVLFLDEPCPPPSPTPPPTPGPRVLFPGGPVPGLAPERAPAHPGIDGRKTAPGAGI